MENGSIKQAEVVETVPNAPPQDSAEKSKKRQAVLTRVMWSFVMIGGFIGTSLFLRRFTALNTPM